MGDRVREMKVIVIGALLGSAVVCSLYGTYKAAVHPGKTNYTKLIPDNLDCSPPIGLTLQGKVIDVTDGDTVKFVPDPIIINVRLIDCWAPEKNTEDGKKSKENLEILIDQKKGTLFIPFSDKNKLSDMLSLDRLLGYVYNDDRETGTGWVRNKE